MKKLERALEYLPLVFALLGTIIFAPAAYNVSKAVAASLDLPLQLKLAQKEYNSALQECLEHGGTSIKPYHSIAEDYYFCLRGDEVIGRIMPTEPYEYVFVPIRR